MPTRTCDILIQAGHENTPDGATGGTGPLGNEIDWTPIVANEAVAILKQAGVDVVKEDASIKHSDRIYHCKLAVFIHFDDPETGESGPSVGYKDDSDKPADSLVAATDRVVSRLQSELVDRATLDRALVKIRSDLYANMEQFGGFGRANLLASFALFDDDPGRINRLEEEFAKVTPELIQRTAREYLRPTNRTVYTVVPGAKSQPSPRGK